MSFEVPEKITSEEQLDELLSRPTDYVIETFQKVFGYSFEKCVKLALDIHHQGRGIVWSGSKEVAELKCELIRSAGPDIYASKRVDWPLGASVEPLPG